MLVKDLIELIDDFEEVTIFYSDSSQEAWTGKVPCLPLRFMNQKVDLIFSTTVKFSGSKIIMIIKRRQII